MTCAASYSIVLLTIVSNLESQKQWEALLPDVGKMLLKLEQSLYFMQLSDFFEWTAGLPC